MEAVIRIQWPRMPFVDKFCKMGKVDGMFSIKNRFKRMHNSKVNHSQSGRTCGAIKCMKGCIFSRGGPLFGPCLLEKLFILGWSLENWGACFVIMWKWRTTICFLLTLLQMNIVFLSFCGLRLDGLDSYEVVKVLGRGFDKSTLRSQ